jgi:hypothetical protein
MPQVKAGLVQQVVMEAQAVFTTEMVAAMVVTVLIPAVVPPAAAGLVDILVTVLMVETQGAALVLQLQQAPEQVAPVVQTATVVAVLEYLAEEQMAMNTPVVVPVVAVADLMALAVHMVVEVVPTTTSFTQVPLVELYVSFGVQIVPSQ